MSDLNLMQLVGFLHRNRHLMEAGESLKFKPILSRWVHVGQLDRNQVSEVLVMYRRLKDLGK